MLQHMETLKAISTKAAASMRKSWMNGVDNHLKLFQEQLQIKKISLDEIFEKTRLKKRQCINACLACAWCIHQTFNIERVPRVSLCRERIPKHINVN